MQRVALLLAVVATLCCDLPFTPEGAEPFDPPAAFAEWWVEMESCSGIRGSFGSVRWFDVQHSFDAPNGEHEAGWWHAPYDVYLASDYETNAAYWPRLVKHEMLHVLTQSGRHSPLFAACGVD